MDKMMKNVSEQCDRGNTVFPEGTSEGARRATGDGPSGKTAMDAEVVAVASRRRFAISYKRRIVREADACDASGAVGELLRREGLYSSHLSHWRKEIEALDAAAVEHRPRGPKPSEVKAADRRAAALELEITKLVKKLERAELVIDAQKKLCNLLGLPTAEDLL